MWRRIAHSGKKREPATLLAIGPNGRAMARIGPLRRGRPGDEVCRVVVFMRRIVRRGRAPDFPATRQRRLTETGDARAQATPLRIAHAVASARPRASILR